MKNLTKKSRMIVNLFIITVFLVIALIAVSKHENILNGVKVLFPKEAKFLNSLLLPSESRIDSVERGPYGHIYIVKFSNPKPHFIVFKELDEILQRQHYYVRSQTLKATGDFEDLITYYSQGDKIGITITNWPSDSDNDQYTLYVQVLHQE